MMLHSVAFRRRTLERFLTSQKRYFQNLAEFDQWREDVRGSRLVAPETTTSMPLQKAAPFLHSVCPMEKHLHLSGNGDFVVGPDGAEGLKSPRDSLLQCTYPLESDELLRHATADFSSFAPVRLGKFYSVVDALTADVAYRHCGEIDGNIPTLVTAGHYQSRKLDKTYSHRDLLIQSYVTQVGTSSMEVRTDAIQFNEEDNTEVLVNVCHTVMVALDKESGKSLGKVGKAIPGLKVETDDDAQRQALAEQHANIRRQRAAKTVQLHAPASTPPNMEELECLHQLHQTRVKHLMVDGNSSDIPPSVKDFTFQSSTIIFPESRNVHGKLFGGFVMEESQSLAQYCATFFAKGKPIIPLGIDEAVFLSPIRIGDMVTFEAKVVHSSANTCRVTVNVDVKDPADRHKVPKRSNRITFVFGGSNFPGILPETYSEMLEYIDAKKLYEVEGPTDAEVEYIIKECRSLKK
mmetsp:Transcript_15780/g.31447  ORF Transcript_15780/g.31447 Transcript_15780/m.31447 type:complete len:463 (+) Transcript_15780:87-1475(+)